MSEYRSVEDFFDRLRSVSDAARNADRVISRAVAHRFRPFALFHPNEVDLSRLMAFLLDPSETHGQGMTFLSLFLQQAGLPDSIADAGAVRVWTEDTLSTGNGRADIRVDYTRRDSIRMHLLIENKPWAGDGNRQIARYAEHMKKAYRENWAIVYMPSTERDPDALAIDPEYLRELRGIAQFTSLPYMASQGEKSIARWLECCAQQCEADGPRGFIRDFCYYINENVSNDGELRMSNAERSVSRIVLEFLQRRDDDVSIALEVEKALRSLRESLALDVANTIADQVQKQLGGGWVVDRRFSNEIYSGLNVRRASWPSGQNSRAQDCRCWIGFEFGSWNWKNPKFGVACHRDIVPEDVRNRIAAAVTAEFPDLWSRDEWWPARHRNLGGIPSDWLSDDFLNFLAASSAAKLLIATSSRASPIL